jgi:pyruvate/2-oxoglutarate dehydrogenase complex dihydrolipoamide dehydrogenase (E3) component
VDRAGRQGLTRKARCGRASDTLAGATFVGPDVAELLHAATTIVGKVTLQTLWHAVPSYSTVSEIWLRLPELRK